MSLICSSVFHPYFTSPLAVVLPALCDFHPYSFWPGVLVWLTVVSPMVSPQATGPPKPLLCTRPHPTPVGQL